MKYYNDLRSHIINKIIQTQKLKNVKVEQIGIREHTVSDNEHEPNLVEHRINLFFSGLNKSYYVVANQSIETKHIYIESIKEV